MSHSYHNVFQASCHRADSAEIPFSKWYGFEGPVTLLLHDDRIRDCPDGQTCIKRRCYMKVIHVYEGYYRDVAIKVFSGTSISAVRNILSIKLQARGDILPII